MLFDPTGRQLSLNEITQVRLAYESGESFGAIGQRYSVCKCAMRRMLRAVGVVPRPRGRAPADVPPLVLEDARAGLSAHQIARKHCVPRHGSMPCYTPTVSPERPGSGSSIRSAAVTNRQAYLRRRPPIKIPCRSPAERQRRAWTAAELEAIDQALRAGRVRHAHRGQSGWSERSFAAWQAASYAFFLAMQRVKAAA